MSSPDNLFSHYKSVTSPIPNPVKICVLDKYASIGLSALFGTVNVNAPQYNAILKRTNVNVMINSMSNQIGAVMKGKFAKWGSSKYLTKRTKKSNPGILDQLKTVQPLLENFRALWMKQCAIIRANPDSGGADETTSKRPAPTLSANAAKRQRRVATFFEEMGNIDPSIPAYFTDGSTLPTNPGYSGSAWVLTRVGMCTPHGGGSDRVEAECSLSLGGGVTNNVAELTAIKLAIQHAANAGPPKVVIASDSMYSIGVCSGNTNANANIELVTSIRELIQTSNMQVEWVHVPAHCDVAFNEVVDKLARDAANESRLNGQ